MRFPWENLAFSQTTLTFPYLAAATRRADGAPRYNRGMDTNAIDATRPRAGSHPNILVVDDEPFIAELVRDTLVPAGMAVTVCTASADALRVFGDGRFDAVLLDVMMPDVDGLELCSRIRAVSRVPVIFLSAKGEEADKVLGLMTGADDYVTKPFLPRELVARVWSVLRRASYEREASAGNVLACRGLEVDEAAHVARLHGEELALTPKEFNVLGALLRAGGRPVGTKELYEGAWGERYLAANANSVMVHIRHLRKKLADIDSEQEFIETVWGVGYKIAP